jgi:hypothetical protein
VRGYEGTYGYITKFTTINVVMFRILEVKILLQSGTVPALVMHRRITKSHNYYLVIRTYNHHID